MMFEFLREEICECWQCIGKILVIRYQTDTILVSAAPECFVIAVIDVSHISFCDVC